MPNTDDVLEYLSKQGFGINVTRLGHLSLTDWNNGIFNENRLGTETGDKMREVIVRPLYAALGEDYLWKPNLRQVFSGLEVTAGFNGSLEISSPKPIFFGKQCLYQFGTSFPGDDGYSQIRLLRTPRD